MKKALFIALCAVATASVVLTGCGKKNESAAPALPGVASVCDASNNYNGTGNPAACNGYTNNNCGPHNNYNGTGNPAACNNNNCIPSWYNNWCQNQNNNYQNYGTTVYAQAGQKIQVSGQYIWGTNWFSCDNHKNDFARTCLVLNGSYYGGNMHCNAAPGSVITVAATGYYSIMINKSGLNNVCQTSWSTPTLSVVP